MNYAYATNGRAAISFFFFFFSLLKEKRHLRIRHERQGGNIVGAHAEGRVLPPHVVMGLGFSWVFTAIALVYSVRYILNPQPSTLSPQPSTLNPQPSTINHYPPHVVVMKYTYM